MNLSCEERQSDSPFVERVWRSSSDYCGPFTSIANPNWSMVVTRWRGKTTMTVRGPEIRATPAYCQPDAEFFGIQFRLGTLMPHLPPVRVMDRHDANLPEAAGQSFWLHGAAWEFPDFENLDTFVDCLAREGLLVMDSVVNDVLQGRPVMMSLRTVQRRFVQATGLPHGTIAQIKRARYAMTLLKQGTSILDTVYQAGYADQPHLTRSLKRLFGRTPVQIIAENQPQPLSFLFNTEPF